VVVPTGGGGGVPLPLPKHATRLAESRTANAPVCANRSARDGRRFSAAAQTKIGESSKSVQRKIPRGLHAGVSGTGGPRCRASGAAPNGDTLFVAVTTLSTMGTCAPDVRFTVAG